MSGFSLVSGFSFLCYDIEDTLSDGLCREKSENSLRAHVGERLGGSKKRLGFCYSPYCQGASFRGNRAKAHDRKLHRRNLQGKRN